MSAAEEGVGKDFAGVSGRVVCWAAGTGRRDRTPETGEGLGQRTDLLTVLEAGCVRSGASKAVSPEGPLSL